MISDETIIDEPMRQPYPSIPQAWGIFGMVLAGQIVASPLILVFGKTGLGIFLMYTVALSLGLLYAVIQKTKTLEQSNEWQPIFQNRSVPAAIYPLCIFFVPIMAMISAPIAQLIPTPEMFKEQLDFMLGDLNIFHFLTVVVAAAFFEESIFRGIILEGFLRRYSPKKAILYSAFLFAFMHINPAQFPHTFLLGIVIGWIYYRTQSIWPCIWIHFVNNGLVFSIVYFSEDLRNASTPEAEIGAMMLSIPIGLALMYLLIQLMHQVLPPMPRWRMENAISNISSLEEE